MQNIELNSAHPDKIYAALKLIQNLYKQGKISKCTFTNILNECKIYIDISEFGCAD